MTAVWMRFRSDLRSRWRGLAALTLLVGVFGGVVLAAAAGARRTATAYHRFTVASPDYDVFLAPEEAVDHLVGPMYDEIDRLPQVRRSARLTAFQIYGLGADGRVDPLFGGQFVTTDRHGRFGVGNPKLLAGRLPAPDRPSEALVNRFVSERLDLHPGDEVTMRLFRGPLDNNPATVGLDASTPITFTVVGIGVFPFDVVPANLLDAAPRVYLSAAGAATYGNPQEVNYAANLIQLRPGSDMARFREDVEAIHSRHPEVQGALNFGLEEERRANAERSIRPQWVALGLFAALLGLTSLLVVGQLLVRQMAFSADDHTSLRAVGMADRQLVALSLLHAVLVAVGGAMVAVGLAVAASSSFPIGPARLAEPDPGLDVNVTLLGVGAALLVVAVAGRAVPPAWRMARLTPARAAAVAQDRATRSGIVGLVAKTGLSPAAVVGASMAAGTGRDAGRGTERRALVATAVALGGLSAALVFGANLTSFLGTPTAYGQAWDFSVDFQYSAVPASEALSAVADNPAVRGLAGGNYGVVTIGGRQVPAVGIDGLRGRTFPTVLEGRPPSGPDEIVLGGSILLRNRLSVGDEVQVGIGEGVRTMRVVGRAVFPLLGAAGLEPTGLGRGAVVAADVLGPGAADAGPESYNFFLISLAGGEQHRRVAPAVRRALEAQCAGGCIVHASQAPGDVVAYGRVRGTPLVLAGVLAALTVATLAQSLVSSVHRRRRDLALLKALGFVPRQVLAAVAWQASAVVLLAFVIGVPLGVVAGRWAWRGLARELGVAALDRAPLLHLLLLLCATVLVANLVAFGPGRAAARVAPASVLHVE